VVCLLCLLYVMLFYCVLPGEVFAQCPDASEAQLNEAVDAAEIAFQSWKNTTLDERKGYLIELAKKIGGKMEDIAKVLVQEQGKPMTEAMGELGGCAAWAQVTASFDIPRKVIEEDEDHKVEIVRKPLGVVGAITPWNFPVMLAMWKIAPATLAGNTVILKPSPYTPLTSLMLGEVMAEVFPPGVVQVLSGGNDIGKWMTAHPGIAKISFTGSTPTGKHIMASAAQDLKRITLELGGNDSAIVMPDVDAKTAAPQIFAGAFANSGQVCSAIKRVFVHESQYDAMVDALAEEAKKASFGDGFADGVQYGPLNNKMQFDKVAEYVDDARNTGAKVQQFGEVPTKGYLYPPTIISNVTDETRIVKEEQFGPALPILSYKTTDEAVARANNTKFGLSSSVWGTDPEAAQELADQLEVGTAWVNQHLAITPTLPFGGSKWSGIGRENGEWGLEHFTEPQVQNVIKKVTFSKL